MRAEDFGGNYATAFRVAEILWTVTQSSPEELGATAGPICATPLGGKEERGVEREETVEG
jgi:hypothetical protein